MKIYTRLGDEGDTRLIGGARVRKCHPRVYAYGEVDELNCQVGLAAALLPKGAAGVGALLESVQADLFVVGAILATASGATAARAERSEPEEVVPAAERRGATSRSVPALPAERAAQLEAAIDRYSAKLPPLRNFILPGGSPAGAALHAARAVCRRAERKVVEIAGKEDVPRGVVVYLNRLSDLLFTLARAVNAAAKEPEKPWKPAK